MSGESILILCGALAVILLVPVVLRRIPVRGSRGPCPCSDCHNERVEKEAQRAFDAEQRARETACPNRHRIGRINEFAGFMVTTELDTRCHATMGAHGSPPSHCGSLMLRALRCEERRCADCDKLLLPQGQRIYVCSSCGVELPPRPKRSLEEDVG